MCTFFAFCYRHIRAGHAVDKMFFFFVLDFRELYRLYDEIDFVTAIRISRLRWAGHYSTNGGARPRTELVGGDYLSRSDPSWVVAPGSE